MARLVLISCASGAFRRAGFTFGHDPLLVDLDELSDGAADAIESEELLTIAEATDEDVARLSGPAAEEPASSLAAFGMANELNGAVSAVLSRFAPDMELAPEQDESPFETIVRLLDQLVGHETPCDKRIASLETELASLREKLTAARSGSKTSRRSSSRTSLRKAPTRLSWCRRRRPEP
jgi:hypothetical protein